MNDSLNNLVNLNGMRLILSSMFPNSETHVVHHAKMFYRQVSSNDCGLFALAYVQALCRNDEPSLIEFDQATMKTEFNNFIDRDLKDYGVNLVRNLTATHNSEMKSYFIHLGPI